MFFRAIDLTSPPPSPPLPLLPSLTTRQARMKKAEDGSSSSGDMKKRPPVGLKKEEGGGGGGGGGGSQSPQAKRKREAKPEVEKRLFPTRKSSGPFRDRLYRAATQRMFLIRHEDLSMEGNLHRRFHVAGSTGKNGGEEKGWKRVWGGLVGGNIEGARRRRSKFN